MDNNEGKVALQFMLASLHKDIRHADAMLTKLLSKTRLDIDSILDAPDLIPPDIKARNKMIDRDTLLTEGKE